VAGWAVCRRCRERIWWGSAPFDASRNWPFDDQDEQVQHFDTCSAINRAVDALGNTHRVGTCRACGAHVWWDTTPRGKRRPMNVSIGTIVVDGLFANKASDECHFDTCPGEPQSEPAAAVQPVGAADLDLWLGQLGLSGPASLEQITRAFRALAMRHHPDMGGSTADFIRIKLAFDRCRELV